MTKSSSYFAYQDLWVWSKQIERILGEMHSVAQNAGLYESKEGEGLRDSVSKATMFVQEIRKYAERGKEASNIYDV